MNWRIAEWMARWIDDWLADELQKFMVDMDGQKPGLLFRMKRSMNECMQGMMDEWKAG